MVDLYDANCYQIDHAANTDLLQMEKNFAALKSNFSGTSQPGNAEAGMDWYDTNATKKLRKTRNAANSAWLGLMQGDTSQLMLVYRNAAGEGWVVNTSLTSDYVVAIKNHGAGTYTTAGAAAGSWTISGTTVDGHALTGAETGAHTHLLVNSGSRTGDLSGSNNISGFYNPGTNDNTKLNLCGISATPDRGISGSGGSGATHTHGVSQAGTWRIRAVVCTLQYVAI